MDTSSNRGPLTAVILAFIIMVTAAVTVYLLVPHRITAISVSKLDLFAPHTAFQAQQGGSVQIVGEPAQAEDDLYVVAHVNITNKLREKVFISGWSATAMFVDGSTADATYVAKSQLPRLEQIFPQIAGLATDPLGDGDELNPGATRSGSIVLLFPNTTEDKWSKKGSAVLTIDLRDRQPQTVKLP